MMEAVRAGDDKFKIIPIFLPEEIKSLQARTQGFSQVLPEKFSIFC